MNTNPIATDTSWEVLLKQQQEKTKKDTPKVKADTEQPAPFVRQTPQAVWL